MNPSPAPYGEILPVTSTPDRYGGVYSGGAWLAFPLDTSAVPSGPFGGDMFAAAWWAETDNVPVGRGSSPNDAYEDLVRRLEAIQPTRIYEPRSELSSAMWEWELRPAQMACDGLSWTRPFSS